MSPLLPGEVPAGRARPGAAWSGRVVRLLPLLVAALAVAGCPRATRFQTRPTGATIYVDGERIGTTPTTFRTRSGVAQRYRIEIVHEGYRSEEFFLDNELSVPFAVCVATPTLIGWLWAWRLDDRYVFELRPAGPAEPPVAPAEPPVAPAEPPALEAPPPPPVVP